MPTSPRMMWTLRARMTQREAEPLGLPHPSEASFRRPDFLGGLPVRLADGGEWVLAGPREVAQGEPALRVAVVALLGEIDEAEEEADQLRGELALAIHLLARNYDLEPADYAGLLAFSPDDPRRADLRESFRALARRHADELGSRAGTCAPTKGRRFPFPPFHQRRTPGEVGRSQEPR